jgi:hypothetical protein
MPLQLFLQKRPQTQLSPQPQTQLFLQKRLLMQKLI